MSKYYMVFADRSSQSLQRPDSPVFLAGALGTGGSIGLL